MNINLNKNEDKLIISLEGRLDTTTSPNLESEYKKLDETNIVLDLKKLNYISSAGLRVLLTMQKEMNKKGTLEIINVCDDVLDIFEVTGFNDILNIKQYG